MSEYKLKANSPAFEIVDGPLAGRKYLEGQVYAEIPPGYEHRFERADKATVTQIPTSKKLTAKSRIEDERA